MGERFGQLVSVIHRHVSVYTELQTVVFKIFQVGKMCKIDPVDSKLWPWPKFADRCSVRCYIYLLDRR